MKKSEARILIYLKQVETVDKYTTRIVTKLDMDYVYTLGVLKKMVEKKWVSKSRHFTKVFYQLTEDAPLQEASSLLQKDAKVKK